MTFPSFWLFGFLNQMGWPRTTGLLIRKKVVNITVLRGGLVALVRGGIALGASRPSIATSLLADPFPKRDWQVSPPTELWNRFDPSKQISAASNKPPEEVIAGIQFDFDEVGQLDSVLKDVIEWDYILLNKDFSLHYHWIFIQGLVWGLSHPEEAFARWEKQRRKYQKNLPEMLSLGLEVQSPETLEEFADAMEKSVNTFQMEIRPLDEIPRELLNFPLIAARLRKLQ
jgi:hypothetical protein